MSGWADSDKGASDNRASGADAADQDVAQAVHGESSNSAIFTMLVCAAWPKGWPWASAS